MAEEEATGGDVASAAITTIYLTGETQPMYGFMEWTAPISGGVSMENNLTRLGAMVPCIYSTSARLIRTPYTYRRSSKAGKMMGRR